MDDRMFIAAGIHFDDTLELRGQLQGPFNHDRRRMSLHDERAFELDFLGMNAAERLSSSVGLDSALNESASFILLCLSSPGGADQKHERPCRNDALAHDHLL